MKQKILLLSTLLLIFSIACTKIEEIPEVEEKISKEQKTEVEVINENLIQEIKEEKMPESSVEEKPNEELSSEEQKVYKGLKEQCATEEQQLGYYIFALKKSDESYCKKIKNADQKELCLAEIRKDPTICEKSEDQKICKAIITKNKDMCNQDDSYCLGLATRDEKYCEEIEDEEQKIDCFLFTELETEEFTEDIIEQKCRDVSYAFMASEQYNDPKFCKYLKNEEFKLECMSVFQEE